MKKIFKAIAVYMTLLTGASYLSLPAISLASEVQNEETKTDFKTRIDNILHPVVSTIPEGNAYIPKDTVINIELTEELSSKKNHVDDDVSLKTLDNIIINDVIVIPAGSLVSGKVTKCTGSGLFGRAGKLEFTINSVKSVNGVEIPLQYTEIKEAGSDDGAVAVAAAVTLIGGLFMKGKNVTFPAGSKMMAKVVADTDLKVKIENLAKEMNPARPHGVVIQLAQ
ncbi:hypothetical protein [uncultured Anaerovibrio sp.]|uniref:hypothetical protein n=1 Tax=uncultured Anaerovibrio sp. TaxID=361586 RepID=UPI0026314A69|nr:hypothetical protein [uncultured Anaerovibrio sp.]